MSHDSSFTERIAGSMSGAAQGNVMLTSARCGGEAHGGGGVLVWAGIFHEHHTQLKAQSSLRLKTSDCLNGQLTPQIVPHRASLSLTEEFAIDSHFRPMSTNSLQLMKRNGNMSPRSPWTIWYGPYSRDVPNIDLCNLHNRHHPLYHLNRCEILVCLVQSVIEMYSEMVIHLVNTQ